MCRALVVEDNPHFSRFLISALEAETSCQVVAHATDGFDALQKAEHLQPDLILLDLGLPKLNGMEVLRRVHKVAPHAKILIISQDSSPEIVEAALGFGANGYVLKSDAGELSLAVDAVQQDRQFVSCQH